MGMIRGVPTGGSLRLFQEMPMLRAQGIKCIGITVCDPQQPCTLNLGILGSAGSVGYTYAEQNHGSFQGMGV